MLPRPLLKEKKWVVGILNVTPDSFHDGGLYSTTEAAITQGKSMISDGADVIDVGGESTRPGADHVSAEEEARRILDVVSALSSLAPVSIDTTKPDVARAALDAGATILNDVRGLRDPAMMEISSDFDEVVLMHSRGTPQNMTTLTQYESIVEDIYRFFESQLSICKCNKIWLDPGIGFAKTASQSLTLIKRLPTFLSLGHPLYLGASRKSFIGKTLRLPKSADRLTGSLGAVAAGFYGGATAFRVHDVRETKQILDLLCAIQQS
ncbi:MAG: dihydropteroate synthase [Myxococcota bacterium]|nr:dihydropteroate synthase [Myxococcota bacterium]